MQTIARTYFGGRCYELSTVDGHYLVTVDGQVLDARTCWVTLEHARDIWDGAAWVLGVRP